MGDVQNRARGTVSPCRIATGVALGCVGACGAVAFLALARQRPTARVGELAVELDAAAAVLGAAVLLASSAEAKGRPALLQAIVLCADVVIIKEAFAFAMLPPVLIATAISVLYAAVQIYLHF